MYVILQKFLPLKTKKFSPPKMQHFPVRCEILPPKMAMMKISASFFTWDGRPCKCQWQKSGHRKEAKQLCLHFQKDIHRLLCFEPTSTKTNSVRKLSINQFLKPFQNLTTFLALNK